MAWNVAEYLGLFLIVLLHEFGHVLACRQVGGVANEIVLWPLGGVAMGRPPPRPGAELWTIVAGPLVNVVLWPILLLAVWGYAISGLSEQMPDLGRLLGMLWLLNKWLLIFNLLPIPILDGGHNVLLGIEVVRKWFGKPPPSEKFIAAFQYVGLAFILTLFVFVTFNDISRLINRG